MPNILPFHQVFANKIFRIPDYQRGYSWQKSQLEDLWTDLENISLLRATYHFTGILTINDFSENDFQSLSNEGFQDVINFEDKIIGEEVYVKELFENSIEIVNVQKTEKNVSIMLKNNSDLVFKLKKTDHDVNLVYFREYDINPHGTYVINVKLNNGVKGGNVNFEVTNLLVKPNCGMQYSYPL